MAAIFTPTQPPFALAGEAASLLAAIIWAGSISAYAVHGRGFPARTLNLYKNLVALVMLTLTVVVAGGPWPAPSAAWLMLVFSGIMGLAVGDTAMFAALPHIGTQRTSAVQCLAPPIAALIALVTMNERLEVLELGGMLVTVLGVLGVVWFGRRSAAGGGRGGQSSPWAGYGLALLAALCQGGGVVLSRFALQEMTVAQGTLLRVLPAIAMIFAVNRLAPGMRAAGGLRLTELLADRRRAVSISVAAFFGTYVGLLLMSAGAKYAKAGVTTALSSTYPVWIIPIARLVLREDGHWTGAVCTVVAVAGVCIMMAA